MNSGALSEAIVICALAAAFEGICAGTGVRAFFGTLRFPKWSAPLWLWSTIGLMYYVTFAFLLYRLIRIEVTTPAWWAALFLIVAMLILNGLANVAIFRRRDLRLSFRIGAFFPVLDVSLFLTMWSLDRHAAMWMVPYLIYRVYGVWWGFALMKANPECMGRASSTR
jgi:tryptophan-rich sensory protein